MSAFVPSPMPPRPLGGELLVRNIIVTAVMPAAFVSANAPERLDRQRAQLARRA
ncbi:hypothetical protein DA2_0164 [Desulfovibrio sp. A2]|nr:hypothetical protein DA2_0164 [Desulfovibrio sp. A2]